MIRAVLTTAAMCRSWPQACITPTSLPLSSFVRAVLANGSPVASVDRQRVELRAQQHGGADAVLQHGDDAGAADARW